jgi:hypothetical protein
MSLDLHLAQQQGVALAGARLNPSIGVERLFQRAYYRGWLGQVWAACTRRSRALLNLTAVTTTCTVGDRYYAGTQAVPIREIRGSEGRCHDFDTAFYPLQPHTESRWLSIATAWQEGVLLPPVDLIRVGAIFFVRDGHHRISVARALGQQDIDAVVTVWEVAEQLSLKRVLKDDSTTRKEGAPLWTSRHL